LKGENMSFLSPVTTAVTKNLTTLQAKEIKVWSSQHSNLFDLRLHTLNTCPFLAYMPHYYSMDKNSYKHKEQDSCTCNKLLA
jgi:hypothetical protein